MAEGIAYTEFVVFANYDGGLDVYMHLSTWSTGKWAFYQIDEVGEPILWRGAQTMRWVRTVHWSSPEFDGTILDGVDLFAARRQ